MQLAESLTKAIRSGQYAPGDALPSYKALAEEYGVAVGTVQSAIGRLREQGVIVTRHGTGSTVRADLDVETLDGDNQEGDHWPEIAQSLKEIATRLATIEAKLEERE